MANGNNVTTVADHGRAMAVSGQAMAVSGQAMAVSGQAMAVSGRAQARSRRRRAARPTAVRATATHTSQSSGVAVNAPPGSFGT